MGFTIAICQLVNTARCDYLNALIAPINIICIRVLVGGYSTTVSTKTNRILNERYCWCVFNRLTLWEQPTFNMLIQPSNGDGFGQRYAHTPIDTVLFYTLKTICVLRDIGIGGKLELLYAHIWDGMSTENESIWIEHYSYKHPTYVFSRLSSGQ